MKAFFKSLFKNEFGTIRYAGWEWAIMRVGFCLMLYRATFGSFSLMPTNIRDEIDFEKANGLPGVIDLEWLGASPMEWVAQYLFLALLIIYATGRWQLVVSGVLLVMHAAIGGIVSSPAKDHHAIQILGLALFGQFVWFAWEFIREKIGKAEGKIHDRPSGVIFFTQQFVVAAYVVSAISKWINSGGGIIPGVKWIQQIPNIAVQFEKNQLQAYYDVLKEPANAELNQRTIDLVINQPGIAMFVMGTAFYLELFAFLALWNRKIGLILGIGLIGMHLSISAIMHLPFWYFEGTCLLLFVNLPYWVSRSTGSGFFERFADSKGYILWFRHDHEI